MIHLFLRVPQNLIHNQYQPASSLVKMIYSCIYTFTIKHPPMIIYFLKSKYFLILVKVHNFLFAFRQTFLRCSPIFNSLSMVWPKKSLTVLVSHILLLAHRCLNVSQNKMVTFIWIHFQIIILKPFNGNNRMFLKFSINKAYILATNRYCTISKITYITTQKMK